MADRLDSALKERLRAVLDDQPVTEAELRKLFEEGHACALILSGQVEREEESRRVGVATDEFRVLADQVEVEPFEELCAVVAADGGQNTPNFGVGECVMEVGEPFAATACKPMPAPV